MLITCLNPEAFIDLAKKNGLIVQNGRFIFDKQGKFITEVEREMFIPDKFFKFIKKIREENPDLFYIRFVCIDAGKKDGDLMNQWELHGPPSGV